MTPILRNTVLASVSIFLLLPLVIVAGASVNEGRQLQFPPRGFTLGWFWALWSEPDWRAALANSVTIALGSALLAVSIAFPLAYGVWHRGGRLARALLVLGHGPFTLPPVVLALAFMIFWINTGGYGQIHATTIAHAIFLVAMPLVTVGLGFNAIDKGVIEAAHSLGASQGQVFRRIIVPLIRPYALSGFAFAFVISLNEYIIANMVSGFVLETIPIKIFNTLHYGYTPIIAAACLTFVFVAVAVFSLMARSIDLYRVLGPSTEES